MRALQTSVTEGAMLGPENAFLVFHLATFHPNFVDKMTAPVVGFRYGPNEAFGGAKCFFVVRADGTQEGISIPKCIESAAPGAGKGDKGDKGEAKRGTKRTLEEGEAAAEE